MDLGEKIRLARTEQNLSQRQLCGQEITRNMLSQIESGKARPSMATLQYLAKQLDLPVSYFLEDADYRPSDITLEQARQAYRQGAFRQALELLESLQKHTQEAVFLEYLCLLELGREAIDQGRLPYARQLLERADAIDTIYKTQIQEQQWQLLMAMAGGTEAIAFDSRPLLLLARQALDRQDPASAIRYLEACDERSAYWALLRGQAALLAGNAREALALLQQAEADFPRQAIPLLEACCKALEDYKMAYHYACLQR